MAAIFRVPTLPTMKIQVNKQSRTQAQIDRNFGVDTTPAHGTATEPGTLGRDGARQLAPRPPDRTTQTRERTDVALQARALVLGAEKLLEAGLVTPEMVARGKSFDDRRKGRYCPNGDGFSLFDKTIDERGASLGAAGYWDLHVHTGAAPRERERFNTKDAKRVLKAFTLGKRRKSARGAP